MMRFKKSLGLIVACVILLVVGVLYLNDIKQSIVKKEYRDVRLICRAIPRAEIKTDEHHGFYIYFKVKLAEFEKRGFLSRRIAENLKISNHRVRDAEDTAREFVLEYEQLDTILRAEMDAKRGVKK